MYGDKFALHADRDLAGSQRKPIRFLMAATENDTINVLE